MKLLTIFSITFVLSSKILFRCDSQGILTNPVTTITDTGRRLNYQSLSSSNRILNTDHALSASDAEYYFKREQSMRDRIIEHLRKDTNRKRKRSVKATPGATDFIVYWRAVYKSGLWFFRMYTARSAMKKLTKAEEARRQEYYCGNNKPDKLKEYCKTAFTNNKLHEKKGWSYDPINDPECVLRDVVLKHYKYKSERGVLKCPILVKKEGEKDLQTSAYISSVDDPPKNHLVFYLLVEADKDLAASYPSEKPTTTTQLSKLVQNLDTNSKNSRKTLIPSIISKDIITKPSAITTNLILNSSVKSANVIPKSEEPLQIVSLLINRK